MGTLTFTSQRIAVLVDSENLEITVQTRYQNRKKTEKRDEKRVYYPEWKSIMQQVIAGRSVTRLIYYKKQSKPLNSKFEKFWREELGGEVRQPEKSVDPYLIIDAVTLAEKCDTVVVLAGDKDYLPLIWYLKSRGTKVEMANFKESTAKSVIEQSDYFHELTDEHVLNLPSKF